MLTPKQWSELVIQHYKEIEQEFYSPHLGQIDYEDVPVFN
jgi:hypothetical protein